jgi:D-lactate dehydrogenase
MARLACQSDGRLDDLEVMQPQDWSCCAFAGDRGLLHPELIASATPAEAQDVARHGGASLVSVSRACELGMTHSTGRGCRHVLEILHETTRQERP